MKKGLMALLFLLSISIMSCDLFFTPSDIYFWSLVDEYDTTTENPIEIKLTYKTVFIMTRGENDSTLNDTAGYDTYNEAAAVLESTNFVLSENTNEIIFDNSNHNKEVKDLSQTEGVGDFHIFQIFEISNIIKDKIYVIHGETTGSQGSVDSADIKVIFK